MGIILLFTYKTTGNACDYVKCKIVESKCRFVESKSILLDNPNAGKMLVQRDSVAL